MLFRSEGAHVVFGHEFRCYTGEDLWVDVSSASFKSTTRGARFEFINVLSIIMIRTRRGSDWAHVVFGHGFRCFTGDDLWVDVSSASFESTTRGARFEFINVLSIIMIRTWRGSDWAHVVFGHEFDLSTHWVL